MDMEQETSPEPKDDIKPYERKVQRLCKACDRPAELVGTSEESWPWILHNRQLHYKCTDCDEEVDIFDGPSFFLQIAIILSLLGLGYYVSQNDGWSYMFGLIADLSLLSLLGIFYLLATLIGALAVISSISTLIADIKARRRFPMTSGVGHVVSRFMLTMLVGLVPWLIAIAFGMYDWFVHDLDESLAYFLIPLIFLPILFAPRLGLSAAGVMLASIAWLGGFILFFDPIRNLF
jgi:hypothetical protein